MVDKTHILDVMREVIDPELNINVVDLGMVGDIEIDGSSVLVNMRLTSMSCPFWGLFVEQVNAAVATVDGVEEVNVQFDRRQPWSPELMTDGARAELEAFGLMPPRVAQGTPVVGAEKLLQLVDGVLTAPQLAANERGVD
jgi:metal-sulfur cluster biosynthetic enzyme